MAILGWQGFSFEHPDDWALASVTGKRSEGYLRMASPGRTGCQVRWKSAKSSGDLRAKLDSYLTRLQSDSRKAKEKFHSDIDEEDGGFTYRWTGAGQGRGKIFHCAESRRVYFLEVIGARKDSLLPYLREMSASFRSPTNPELWSVFGLCFNLPRRASLESKSFLTGRTTLKLKTFGARIHAERWAFGEQLVAKHGLRAWADGAIGLKRARVDETESGLSFRKAGVLPLNGLVKFDSPRNQLVVLQVASLKSEWRPTWDWLNC